MADSLAFIGINLKVRKPWIKLGELMAITDRIMIVRNGTVTSVGKQFSYG